MTIDQACLVLDLWRTKEFDTNDIAKAVGAPEADVERVIHEVREYERGSDLQWGTA